MLRAQAFNSLVFGEIGFVLTTRFIKMSTFHPRVFFGNPLCFGSMLLTAALQVGEKLHCSRRLTSVLSFRPLC